MIRFKLLTNRKIDLISKDKNDVFEPVQKQFKIIKLLTHYYCLTTMIMLLQNAHKKDMSFVDAEFAANHNDSGMRWSACSYATDVWNMAFIETHHID